MSEPTPRGYQPLAPRPQLLGGGGGTLAGGSGQEEKRIRRASTACTECQKRRTRCTGPPHCTECSHHARECVFDEAADRRRKVSAKRIQDQLDHYRGLTEDLIDVLRDSDGPTVQSIVNTIRSGAQPGEIRDTLTRILENNNRTAPRYSGVQESISLDYNMNPHTNNMNNYPKPG
jgi:hypothetical protein